MEDDLLKLVPVGEENAVSARLIWQQYGIWSPGGVRYTLNAMALRGLIERKMPPEGSNVALRFFKRRE
jgi:hypothetical protein